MTILSSARTAASPLAILLLVMTLPSTAIYAQNTEEKAVLETINGFFKAMTEKDVNLARDVVRDDGFGYGVVPGETGNENGGSVRRSSFSDFIGHLEEGDRELVETMYQPAVQIRGPIAMVWTAYDFYIDQNFSHCGVDIFTLVKSDGKWKISGVVYTVEKKGCENVKAGF